jgi:phosphotransferase system HPr-like phosphotransfer protein
LISEIKTLWKLRVCLAVRKGEEITLIADGIDENNAIEVLEIYLLSGKK